MLNNPRQFNNTKIDGFSQWLIRNKMVKNEKEAQTLRLLILVVICFIVYWFFFVRSNPVVIDPALIENAGSPEEIINT